MKKIEDLKELQKMLLKILVYVDEVCQKNNLRYSLFAGTAIGAIREKGYIPWDDDIDIMMPREDYEKFLELMKNSPDKNYKCIHNENTKNYYFPYAKVIDLSTKIEEANGIQIEDYGLFVDIFPIDFLPEGKEVKTCKKYLRYFYFTMFSLQKKFTKSPKGFVRTLCKLPAYVFARMFGYKFWNKRLLAVQQTVKQIKSAPNMTVFCGTCRKIITGNDVYLSGYVDVDFEGHKFKIVEQYDKYLTLNFGDYMTPPPKDQQHSVHTYTAYIK